MDIKRMTVSLVAGLAMTAGPALAQQDSATTTVKGVDQLVVKSQSSNTETWVRPDADIGRYDKITVWKPIFEFREGGETRTGTPMYRSRRDRGPYAIKEEDRIRFEKIVSEAFLKELNKNKFFEVVDQPGAGTLIVAPAIVDIVSDVPPNANTGFEKIYLATVGQATIVFDLIDAETGIIQARVAERREIQPPARKFRVSSTPANSATIWNDIKLWAASEAQNLRRELEKAKKKASK